jgi:hypothetical protein
MPDAESYAKVYLLKCTSVLRLTYQIRLLAFRAAESQRLLVIQVPRSCHIGNDLQQFAKQHRTHVRIEKVE